MTDFNLHISREAYTFMLKRALSAMDKGNNVIIKQSQLTAYVYTTDKTDLYTLSIHLLYIHESVELLEEVTLEEISYKLYDWNITSLPRPPIKSDDYIFDVDVVKVFTDLLCDNIQGKELTYPECERISLYNVYMVLDTLFTSGTVEVIKGKDFELTLTGKFHRLTIHEDALEEPIVIPSLKLRSIVEILVLYGYINKQEK